MQAREGIVEAEVSMGLLDVQSQLGLLDKGPLAPRSLAEAALQVGSKTHSCPQEPSTQQPCQSDSAHPYLSW